MTTTKTLFVDHLEELIDDREAFLKEVRDLSDSGMMEELIESLAVIALAEHHSATRTEKHLELAEHILYNKGLYGSKLTRA